MANYCYPSFTISSLRLENLDFFVEVNEKTRGIKTIY